MMSLSKKLLTVYTCIALFSACKKDKSTPNSYISFKVNGVYSNLSPEANIFEEDNNFLLDAGGSSKNEISLFLDTNVLIKTFDLSKVEDGAICDYYNKSGEHFWSDSGTLVIGAFNGSNISGTFAFRGRTLTGSPDTIRITDGQFSAKVSYLAFSTDTGDNENYSAANRLKMINAYRSRKKIILNNIKIGRMARK